MRNYISFLFFIVSLNLFSQTTFDKGYYITNSGDTIHCLIKNLDWLNNPSSFEYKITEDSELQTGNIKYVKYFEIYNQSKYIRATVKIDESSTALSDLSSTRNPTLVEREFFLKEISSGNANLYVYRQSQLEKFFYSINTGEIKSLIYKSYLVDGDKIAYNIDYQQELFNNLVCSDITLSQIKQTAYKENNLIKLFNKYNRCKNPDLVTNISTKKKGEFNVTIRPRVNFTNADFNRAYVAYDFGKKTTLGLGIELEYVLPFNNKKWSLFTDPNYISINNSTTVYKDKIDLVYKAIEIPVGVRYGIFLNTNSKLYINVAYVIDVNLNSELKRRDANFIDLKTLPNYAFGIGYKFKNRYSVEFRSTTSKNLTKGYMYWDSSFNNTSIILGYRIF